MFTVHSLEPRSCVEVEGDVLGSPPLMVLIVSVDVNLNSELRSCVKVEVAVLGSPSLTVRTVSVNVKRHEGSSTVSDVARFEALS